MPANAVHLPDDTAFPMLIFPSLPVRDDVNLHSHAFAGRHRHGGSSS
jgi:hypothetical protein